jgi:hypothetical protein
MDALAVSFFWFPSLGSAQEKIRLTGKVTEAENGEPLMYANMLFWNWNRDDVQRKVNSLLAVRGYLHFR